MDNRKVFSNNLRWFMRVKGKSRREVSEDLGISYHTFTDWYNGKKFPRMDKVEMLAEYFGILKSDLIEERTPEHREMQKKNDTLSDIVIRMQSDDVFFSVVEAAYEAAPEKLLGILALLK